MQYRKRAAHKKLQKVMESEKTLEKKVKKTVECLGGWCIKLLSSHTTGLPDRLCLLPKGQLIFIEVKTTKKKPTKIQTCVHGKIKALGFTIEVVDSTQKIKELFGS